jgi:hypothetical protein
LFSGQSHRVDEQDVLPAVVIVVEKRAAGADRLREILLAEGAAVVFESECRLGGDVGELDPRLRDEAASGSGTGESHGLFCWEHSLPARLRPVVYRKQEREARNIKDNEGS